MTDGTAMPRPLPWRQGVLSALLMGSQLMVAPAHASFFEHCVFYGEVQSASKLEDGQYQLVYRVQQTMALRGSHTRCSDYRGSVVQPRLSGPPARPGEWLLLRYERQDGMCSPTRSCSSEHWQWLES